MVEMCCVHCMFKNHGFLARLWPGRLQGRAKSHLRPTFWLGFGLGTKAKKPRLFGLRPKPVHHYMILFQPMTPPRGAARKGRVGAAVYNSHLIAAAADAQRDDVLTYNHLIVEAEAHAQPYYPPHALAADAQRDRGFAYDPHLIGAASVQDAHPTAAANTHRENCFVYSSRALAALAEHTDAFTGMPATGYSSDATYDEPTLPASPSPYVATFCGSTQLTATQAPPGFLLRLGPHRPRHEPVPAIESPTAMSTEFGGDRDVAEAGVQLSGLLNTRGDFPSKFPRATTHLKGECLTVGPFLTKHQHLTQGTKTKHYTAQDVPSLRSGNADGSHEISAERVASLES
ncbi:hypothetical protein DFH09DRAFT_1095893 [Mycena vulgaris]|nr:hypothetical protein DFH09DRAFT_1095893 [Mycena vulgaris]